MDTKLILLILFSLINFGMFLLINVDNNPILKYFYMIVHLHTIIHSIKLLIPSITYFPILSWITLITTSMYYQINVTKTLSFAHILYVSYWIFSGVIIIYFLATRKTDDIMNFIIYAFDLENFYEIKLNKKILIGIYFLIVLKSCIVIICLSKTNNCAVIQLYGIINIVYMFALALVLFLCAIIGKLWQIYKFTFEIITICVLSMYIEFYSKKFNKENCICMYNESKCTLIMIFCVSIILYIVYAIIKYRRRNLISLNDVELNYDEPNNDINI